MAISQGLNLVGGLAKFGIGRKLAKQQMERSNRLRGEASAVKKPAIRPEFQTALTGSKLRTLTGLPNEQTLKDEADLEVATNLGRGQAIASSGGELLQYAASLGADANKIKRGIGMESMAKRDLNYDNYLNTLWNVGGEESRMEDIKRARQADLYRQASALEDASTANKYDAARGLINDITSSAAGLAGSFTGKQGATNSSGGLNVTPIEASQIPTTAPASSLINVANSRNMLAGSSPFAGFTDADKIAIQRLSSQYPDMDIEEVIALYKQNKMMH